MLNDSGALVVIIGAPGAGKTKVGKKLAKILDAPLIDTDKVVVASHGPIAELFAEFGEEYFREREREAVANALLEPAVVTLGGGAVLNQETRADIASGCATDNVESCSAPPYRRHETPPREER